ncbi:MAG: 2-isopropylmalate synthase, partial [Leptospiraceae bacterium]|nr:2-isopropylmalate synthase [Leptospiraceae bacterium]
EKYIGYFKNGNYHGYGKMITVDGDYYEGEFKNDKFDGNGYIRYKDGYLYVGKFKDGKRNGEGTLYKKMYDGVWENDIRNKVD